MSDCEAVSARLRSPPAPTPPEECAALRWRHRRLCLEHLEKQLLWDGVLASQHETKPYNKSSRTNVGRIRPITTGSGPNSSDRGLMGAQIWPKSAEFGRLLADFGPGSTIG